jgi:hypothetical protein
MRLINLIILSLIFVLIGCKSEDPAPELRDPIYNDLNKKLKESEDSLKKSSDKIISLEKDYNSQEPRTIDRKTSQKELFAEQQKVIRLTQEVEYYRIAVLKRKAESQIIYKRAFAADKEWPDPKEYESYQLNQKMRETPRNWNIRIPKLQNPANPTKDTPSEEKEE